MGVSPLNLSLYLLVIFISSRIITKDWFCLIKFSYSVFIGTRHMLPTMCKTGFSRVQLDHSDHTQNDFSGRLSTVLWGTPSELKWPAYNLFAWTYFCLWFWNVYELDFDFMILKRGWAYDSETCMSSIFYGGGGGGGELEWTYCKSPV